MNLKKRELFKLLQSEGVEDAQVVKRRRSGHHAIHLKNGQIVFCSGTPSDPRTIANLRAQIRRSIK